MCGYAAWTSRRLGTPVALLHAIDHRHATAPAMLSGNIGLGSHKALLEELAEHDRQAGKMALERGRQMLDAARSRIAPLIGQELSVRQVHGPLVDRLVELEPAIRVLVLGKRGEAAHVAQDHLGNNVERTIRAIHRPILVVPAEYREPPSFIRARLARAQLESAGFVVHGGVYPGDAETVLTEYRRDHAIDLLVMGAYGHSRIRHLLVGSTTTAMIRHVTSPLLLLR